jgi:hypothetical protein
MENQTTNVDKIYDYAADLLIRRKLNTTETENALMEYGLDYESARMVVSNLQEQISQAKKEAANKDMLYGALWCLGGIAATVSDFGLIFWGAIVFGGIQFIKGVANSN